MTSVLSEQMKRAIVNARRRLRDSSVDELQGYGLNRYRVAQKKKPLVVVVNRRRIKKRKTR